MKKYWVLLLTCITLASAMTAPLADAWAQSTSQKANDIKRQRLAANQAREAQVAQDTRQLRESQDKALLALQYMHKAQLKQNELLQKIETELKTLNATMSKATRQE